MQNSALKTWDLFRYSALAFPLGCVGIPLYLYAPDFYATQFGVSLASLSFAILLLRCIDAVQDPLFGWLSDQYPSMRHFGIILAAFLMAGCFYLLFFPPPGSPLFWFAIATFGATSGFSFIGINLNAIGAVWHPTKIQKTRINAGREFLGMLGLLCAVALPSIAISYVGQEHQFTVLSIFFIVVTFIALILFVSWFSPIKLPQQNPRKITFPKRLKIPSGIKLFYLIYAVSMIASALPAVLVLFFVRDLLQAGAYFPLFMLSYFCVGAFSIPVWRKITNYLGVYQAWALSMAVAILSFIWAYSLGPGSIWQYAYICLASGIAFGADLVLPPTILSILIGQQSRQQQATTLFGLMSFIAKMALALASAAGLFILDRAGFQPASANTDGPLHVLSILYALVPCALKVLSFLILTSVQPFTLKQSIGEI